MSLDAPGDEAESPGDVVAAVKREAKKAKHRSGSKERKQETPKDATRVKNISATAKVSIVNQLLSEAR